MLPYTNEQLDAAEHKHNLGGPNSRYLLLSYDEVSRLFVTVRLAWEAVERAQKEAEQAKQTYQAGLKAGLLLVKELAEQTFNVKIPKHIVEENDIFKSEASNERAGSN